MIRRFVRFVLLGVVMLFGLAWPTTSAFAGSSFVMPDGLSDIQRKRYESFLSFQIRGVCGDRDLDSLIGTGVNTVRGYTIPAASAIKPMIDKLDHAHRLGMKVVLSEWMPHHGKNKSRDGSSYDFDYNTRGDQMVANFIAKLEAIGDHPAILLWGFGNEVHLDEPYLRVVNRMSIALHERFPHHLSSLTMVNAKPEHIAKIREFAPDLDVLGIQSYSRGAVLGAIKSAETNWGKPFYLSEFNTQGPWHYPKSDWGDPLDSPNIAQKVADLKACFEAIDASPLCLGSTIFLWGNATNNRPTDFSLHFHPNPSTPGNESVFAEMWRTPQAEVMIEHFTGKPIEGNRAPVMSKLEFAGGAPARLAKPGESVRIDFAASDADGDAVEYVTWILDASAKLTTTVAGPLPQSAADHAMIVVPQIEGQYRLMVYAIDNKGGASASTVALLVTRADTFEPVANPAKEPEGPVVE